MHQASPQRADPPDSSFLEEAGSTKWLVVALLTVGMAVAYTDRVNLSVALSDISKTLSLDAGQQGLALSAFFVSYALLQIPAGWLVDRYGVRTPYIIGFLLWSAASASMAFVGSFMWLCALRLLLGVGEAVVMPASMRYIRMHFDEEHRGFAVGVFMTGTKIGPAVGFPVAAYLMASFGWKWMFILSGLVPLLWILPYLKWVKKDDVAAVHSQDRSRTRQEAATVSMGAIMASPAMWGTILGTFCYMYFFYYCLTWMPVYFHKQYGLSVEATGWYAGISFAGMATMAVVGGKAADKLISRGYDAIKVRKAFTLTGLGLAATQTLSIVTESTSAMLFFSAFGLCGLGLATANYWALTQTLIPGGAVGTVVGIQNTAGSLAGIVAPALTGWMIERTGSVDTPIWAIGIWLALGIASYVFLVKPRYAPRCSESLVGSSIIKKGVPGVTDPLRGMEHPP